MIDIHCHILPGVDDGSKSWDMTLEMCHIAAADGITHIVATPHANFQYRYERGANLESLARLREQAPYLAFSLGCDFHLSEENIEDATLHRERYVIGNSAYILVEFSDFQTPRQMTEALFKLHSLGLQTIVTHPERNSMISEYPDLPEQFVDMGSMLQITASALTGGWGRRAKKTCDYLLKKGLIALIATDAHDSTHRKPTLSAAERIATKSVGSIKASTLLRDNPGILISN